LERKIRYFVSEIEKFDLELVSAGSIEEFIQEEDHHPHHFHHPFDDPTDEGIPSMTTATSSTAAISLSSSSPQQPSRHKFGSSSSSGSELLKALEIELSSYELQLRELNTYNEKLTREYNEKVEFQETLEKARRFLYADASRLVISSRHQHRLNEEQEHGHDDDDAHARGEDWLGAGSRNTTTAGQPLPHASDLDLRFSSLTGVVNTDEKVRFERMIFRATRGNCYVRFAPIRQPIVDPETGDAVQKSVFVIFYKSESIELKLKRICDAFSAHRYTLPPMVHDIDHILTDNAQELVDSRTVLLKNQDARFRLCTLLSKHAERWTWIVLREKAVYHTLNMFKADVSGVLRGEGWVVRESTSEVKRCVERAHAHMTMPSLVDLVPQPWPTPPTHFVTNKFTYGYQEFVNTYGIPRYREANPALFTAATFPFLFGVMYGDIGHGLFLFSAGLYLLWNETANEKNAKNLGEMMEGLHAGRYMITMMGFFAIYAGLIYNDCFSLGLDLFGSRWKFPGQDHGVVQDGEVAELISGAEYGSSNSVYPFGLDPIWHVSVNELLFFNSFKMKLSVIFGIIQMFAGTCLKGANAIYFGQKLDFYYEFIPMALFASSLFLYMVFLIFYKWTIDWNSRMLSATCIDPSSSAWGSSAYEGTWIVCDTSSGDGTCTPWGYSCTGKDDTAKKCPLNYGGSGDGCQVRTHHQDSNPCTQSHVRQMCHFTQRFCFHFCFIFLAASQFDHDFDQHCIESRRCRRADVFQPRFFADYFIIDRFWFGASLIIGQAILFIETATYPHCVS
jgi:V-type H+-transporting ATPase subunit a